MLTGYQSLTCQVTSSIQLELIYCYKLVFGLVKLNTGDFLSSLRFLILGHAYKLCKPRCSRVRVYFFSCRVINVWNSLPESTR